MAETTITGLPAVSVPALAAVLPIDQSGTTYKLSLNQLEQLLGSGETLVFVNPQSGSDTTGNGSALNPYATITHANSVITTNDEDNRYCILFQGVGSEAAPKLKPFVSIIGLDVGSSILNITGGGQALLLDSSWDSSTTPMATIANINFISGSSLDFDTSSVTDGPANIYIRNCIVNGTTTFLGFSGGSDVVNIVNTTFISQFSAQDINLSTSSCTLQAFTPYTNELAIGPISWISSADVFFGGISITAGHSQMITMTCTGCYVNTSVSISGADAYFAYDPGSYPQQGFNLFGGNTAPLFCSPSHIPITRVGTSTYNIDPSDFYISCDFAGTINLYLDSTVTSHTFTVKDSSGAAGSNNIIINGNGNNIDGSSTYTINNNYGSITITGDVTHSIWLTS